MKDAVLIHKPNTHTPHTHAQIQTTYTPCAHHAHICIPNTHIHHTRTRTSSMTLVRYSWSRSSTNKMATASITASLKLSLDMTMIQQPMNPHTPRRKSAISFMRTSHLVKHPLFIYRKIFATEFTLDGGRGGGGGGGGEREPSHRLDIRPSCPLPFLLHSHRHFPRSPLPPRSAVYRFHRYQTSFSLSLSLSLSLTSAAQGPPP